MPHTLEELAQADLATQRKQADALAAGCGDAEAASACAAALEEMGPPAADLLPELVVLLAAEAGDTAYWAATLLGRLGETAAPAVASLTRLAVSELPLAARERAVWALGEIGPAAREAAPTLAKLALSDEPRMARLAQKALDRVGAV
ncbi:hypothetical protein Mal64_29850 [Pseudobythopirellula maris]|uniref:HEAT repeat protein n=1 Tax=Pseudobythopirellula maris TaxID=2527991 RepID=A0A5C5ZJP1_9BACT|nr:HEAT repeat domain-containing protein [Pseudobythopirellula maris]TWT87446.1 hypothetical protein Mal64_29850 [Pseudobythopirellula maris]